MHVACPCAQRFTMYDGPLPRRISCHACGRKLVVVRDGVDFTVHEIRALAVQAACVCGQSFTVHAEQFPKEIRCTKCGKTFIVLDTGDRIESHEKLIPAPPDPTTAIHDGRALLEPMPIPGAIYTGGTKARLLEEKRAGRSRGAAAGAEDDRFAMACRAREQGVGQPVRHDAGADQTIGAAVLGVVSIGACLGFVFFLALQEPHAERGGFLIMAALGMLGATLGFHLAKHLYRQAEWYDRAEADWQRKRFAALAKQGVELPVP